jgi:hypothetical protein
MNHRLSRLRLVCGRVVDILELNVRQWLNEHGFNIAAGITS